jgi:hypothetical protein
VQNTPVADFEDESLRLLPEKGIDNTFVACHTPLVSSNFRPTAFQYLLARASSIREAIGTGSSQSVRRSVRLPSSTTSTLVFRARHSNQSISMLSALVAF